MMHGIVSNLQARVEIPFRLLGQPNLSIEFVVDTGFAGALTLPASAIAAMGLPFWEAQVATLADDRVISIDAHRATVVWCGQDVDVAVLAMGRRPLLGTALLDGYNLSADFADNGPVTVRRLP